MNKIRRYTFCSLTAGLMMFVFLTDSLPVKASTTVLPALADLYNLDLELDGVDDYASAPDAATLDLGTGATDDFTIETSFYVPDLTNTTLDTLIWKNGAYGLYIIFYTSQPDRFIFRTNTDPTNYVYLFYNVELGVGWHHVAAVFDNEYTVSQDLIALYLDGNLAGSSTATEWTPGIPNSSSSLNVGGYLGVNPLYGWLEETRLSNIVRYSGTTYVVPASPLAADGNTNGLWHFDDGWGAATFADSSFNGNTLTGQSGAHVGNPPGVPPESTQIGPTYMVNKTSDGDDGVCGILDCTLREAINASNSAIGENIIVFDDALGTNTITVISGILTISDPNGLIILGGGDISISGNNTIRPFNIASTGVGTFENLTIKDGYNGLYGGGVLNTGALTISNSVITENNTDGYGGGIANDGTLNITNSTISSNYGSTGAGGIYSIGGVITIFASTFSGNTTPSNVGGGIYNNASILNISDSTFSGNTGSAIYNTAAANIERSIFSDNFGGQGGGIRNDGGSLTLDKSLFYNNTAGSGGAINSSILGDVKDVNITNSTFYNNSASGGGAIVVIGGNNSIINSTFSGNSANDNFGGAIYLSGTLTMANSIIAHSPTGGNCRLEIGSTLINGGHNLDSGTNCNFGTNNDSISNTDPNLGPLQSNGGSTLTMALQPSSPAIDAGDNLVCVSASINNLDQRGDPRPLDGDKNGSANCDIGAYESAPWSQPGAFVKTSPYNAVTNQPPALTISWGTSVDAASYEYCIDNINNSSCDNSWNSVGNDHSANLNNLTPNSTYYWQVRVTNAYGITNADSGMWWSFTVTPLPENFGKSTPANGAIDQPLNSTLLWDTSTYAANYEYCYDTSNDANCDGVWMATGTNTSIGLSGLVANTSYYWQVRANNSSGTIYANNGTWWSFTTLPNAPMTFSKSVPESDAIDQSTSPTLSWNTSIGTSVGYEYCYDTSNNSTCNNLWIATGANTSIGLSGLYRGTTYYWQVRAVNVGGTTYANGSIWWSFTTVPYAPSIFYKSAPDNGAINQSTAPTMVWEASASATSYEICYDIIGNDLCDSTWIAVGTATSANLNGLTTNTTYYWQIRAINTGGTTYANDDIWWSFITIPNAPTPFSKSTPSNGATDVPANPTLLWDISAGSASYEYCYDTTNNSACDNSWASTETNTSIGLSSLATSTTYYWQVRAINTSGTTFANSGTWWSFTTEFELPGPFSKLSPINAAIDQPTSVTINWSPSVVATRYEYCYDTINDSACVTWSDNGISTTKTLAGLLPATTYYWHIRAVNIVGTTYSDGNATEFWSFTTLPNSPAAFDKSNPGNGALAQPTSLILTWNSSAGAVSYQYCYDTTNDSSCSSWIDNDTATAKALSGLTPGATYYWQVRAVNTGGTTYANTSTWWSFTTMATISFFADLPADYWARQYIERLYNAGITGGCTAIPLNYCPTTPVTRAQMAVFLLRGIHGSGYTPPTATGTRFNDVPLGTFGAAWIEQLATEGITSGCGGGNYCPNQTVSRAQMAIFLVRAKHGVAFVPPMATGVFSDVPIGSFGANYIEQLVADAITSGCGSSNYCPNTMVKRDSMAVFLVKTFGLP